MPSSSLLRPAPSLPVNEETIQLSSPPHSPRNPTKTFSTIITHLKHESDSSSQKLKVPKPSSSRPVSSQSCDVNMFLDETPRVKTPRVTVKEVSKTNSTIMSHCTLPPSNPPSTKPTPRTSYIDPPSKRTTQHYTPSDASDPPLPPQTRYVDMLLGLDEVPRSHNLLASFSTWILLAGFIVVPGTFVSIEENKALQRGAKNNQIEHAVLNTVKHASLIWVASLCCAMGWAGMVWLWWRWRRNYVWVINKIFLVGLLNSLAGLISTLINVYSQQRGKFSITARITVGVTASCTLITALLYFLYNFFILQGIRKEHDKEWEAESGKGKRATMYK